MRLHDTLDGVENVEEPDDARVERLDRLLVGETEVLVVDYKTNREPPASEADIPAAYVRQMAAYRAALQAIYPEKSIRCALLWTAAPRLIELSEAALDKAAP